MPAASFQQVHKALQFITDRAADQLSPILCKFWDEVPAEAIQIVFDAVPLPNNEVAQTPKSALGASQDLKVRLLAEKPETVAVLAALGRFSRWLESQEAVRTPLPDPVDGSPTGSFV